MVLRPISQGTEMKGSPSNASHAQDNRPFETPRSTVVFTGDVPSFWAVIYMDNNGNVGETSNLPSNFFTEEQYQDFRNASELAGQRDQQLSMLPVSTALRVGPSRRSSRFKRRRGNVREEPLAVECIDSFDDEMDLVPLKIGDTDKVSAYYESVFKRLQQLNCRMLAKSFIKLIEPRKQVRHPYNGGRGSAPGERGDPEMTKPDWWPRDVIHKEPDHLRKELRLKLLVHIIQQLLPMGITADKLEEVANDSRRLIKPPSKVGMLDELFRVRKLEESFVRQEVDATTVIYVVDHEGAKKKEPGSDCEDEFEEEVEDSKTPPGTPHIQASHDTSPVDIFQMPPDLNFGSPDGQIQFQSSQPDIGHQCLATASTPIPAPVMTPTANQFMHHSSPFPSPTSQEQMQSIHHPIQPQMNTQSSFSAWSPAFNQSMFTPVDYTGVNRQQMGYPAYTVCPTPPAHQVPSPHTIPDVDRSQFHMMNMGSLPFRTGSLNHPNLLPRPDGAGVPQM
ncbi:uncharacterized protein TRUGW13939_08231 [Talaromyces rugulosus]|uniref:Subtelomeric hrmA-associated cluster protein AFUB-079030/YDR124W-like helical bundle domain-containing protein n=1 Tax=Talaromyces rugulosus TaxID=121627 RepID=A0A7H8R684_TALRU|nr:uncharacterized protein TRUGW13939_08231 [Talaromyces rugulosus]QKX61085.1 hypothetical protein TRUGW13939_08231 [Talaromyces rugulosus]